MEVLLLCVVSYPIESVLVRKVYPKTSYILNETTSLPGRCTQVGSILLCEDRGFCAKSPDPLSRKGWGLGTRLVHRHPTRYT